MALNLTSTDHLLELVTTGTGAIHVVASFIDDNAGTKTGGSQSTVITTATTTTVVSAPGASITRSVHHVSVVGVGSNTVTIQKDVASTDHTLIGPVTLAAGERLEFTASKGWGRVSATGFVSNGSWEDVLANGNTSGANNPTISAGQGLVVAGGQSAGAGDIRSASDITLDAATDIHVHAGGDLHLGHVGETGDIHAEAETIELLTDVNGINISSATTANITTGSSSTIQTATFFAVNATGNIVLTSSAAASLTGTTSVSVTSDNNGMVATPTLVSFGAGTSGVIVGDSTSMIFRTNNVVRLTIGTAGGWSLAGDEGTSGQVLTSNGASTPPTWEAVPTAELTFEDDGVSQGTASIIDVVDGVYTTGTAIVALGQATMAWDVNLSALVPSIAGTGLENSSSTLRIASAAAGDGLTGGGGSALAVGAGTGIQVNANDVQLAPIAANTFLMNPLGSSAEPQAVAGSLVAGAGLTYTVGGVLAIGAGNSMAVNADDVEYVGTSSDVVLTDISGAQGVVDISSLVCGGRVAITSPDAAWSIAGFSTKPEGFWFIITAANTDFPGTILNEASSASTDVRCPGHVDFSANRSMSGMFMYGAFGSSTRWLFIPGALDSSELALQVRKPLTICRWHEDFECVNGTSATGPHHFGQTVWITTALSTSGAVIAAPNEQHHPGIASVQTDGNDDSVYCIHRGGSSVDDPWIRGDEIKEFNAIARYNTSANLAAFFIGFSENPADQAITGILNSNIIGFFHDSDTDTSVHCVTRESDGTAVDTDTGFSPGTTWHRYTIRQTTLGTVEFLIDGVIEATHTTQVPDTESMNCGITIVSRDPVGTVAQLYVDYVDFESHPLTR